MPDRKRTAKLRLISWNVYVGNKPARIRTSLMLLAALFWPHAICLQEARRFKGTIPGYMRYASTDKNRDDSGQNIILVRRGVNVEGAGPENVPGDGWTYNGNPKPPRTFYGLIVWVANTPWHILNVHRCVGGPNGNSPDEWAAEDATIETWAGEMPNREPTIIVGDHNDRGTTRRPGTVADLAHRINADILTVGDTIDYALIRDCDGIIRRLARNLGSDHAPQLITLTEP